MKSINFDKNFEELDKKTLANIEGGLIITGTAVATGVAIFAGSFAVGYAVGQSLK